jgi:MFS family permease
MVAVRQPADRATSRQILQLGVLALSSSLMALVLCVMVPAMPGIAAHFASSPNAVMMAQILLLGPFIAQIIGPQLAGTIIGKAGRRFPLLLSLAVIGGSGLAGYWVESFWALLLCRLISCFATAVAATVCATLVGDYFEGRLQVVAVSWLGIMPSFVSVVALLLAGYLVKIGGWHMPFLLFLITVPIWLAAFFIIEESCDVAVDAGARELARLPRGMGVLTFWMFLGGIGTILSSVQLPFFLGSLGVTDPVVAPMILGVGAIVATIGAALYPWLKARLAAAALMGGIYLLMGLAYIGTGFAASVTSVCALMLVMSLGSGLVVPYFTGAAMDISSSQARPRAMGMIISAMFAGWFVAPFLVGFLRSLAGDAGVFGIVGALLTAFGLIFLLMAGQSTLRRARSGGK